MVSINATNSVSRAKKGKILLESDIDMQSEDDEGFNTSDSRFIPGEKHGFWVSLRDRVRCSHCGGWFVASRLGHGELAEGSLSEPLITSDSTHESDPSTFSSPAVALFCWLGFLWVLACKVKAFTVLQIFAVLPASALLLDSVSCSQGGTDARTHPHCKTPPAHGSSSLVFVSLETCYWLLISFQ